MFVDLLHSYSYSYLQQRVEFFEQTTYANWFSAYTL